MSKQFIKGNVYVFTKKKFLEERSKRKSKAPLKPNLIWVNMINGNEVTFKDNFSGEIRGLSVYAEWCKCIKNNNPKIESEAI